MSSSVSFVSGGFEHIMVINSGVLYGSGLNSSGQLGLSNTSNRNTFTPVTSGLSGEIWSVSAGNDHTMVITSDGLYATGLNTSGQLGLGDNANRSTFTKVMSGLSGEIFSVSAGVAHTMVITSDGLYATGLDSSGQLGVEVSDGSRNTFTKVTSTGLTGTILSVSCGENYTMVLTSTGLFSTGSNAEGQFGNNTTNSGSVFGQVTSGLSGTILSVSTGSAG